MNNVYIQLGSNIGIRESFIAKSKEQIEKNIGEIILESSVIETNPWGNEKQNKFLNCVIKIKTPLNASRILEKSQEIECNLGRIREEKWGKRTIDIDILFYNTEIINTKKLNIPHPLIHKRDFVLIPLSEIAPNYIHPIFNKKISDLLNEHKKNQQTIKL